jgi:hypothetical protein
VLNTLSPLPPRLRPHGVVVRDDAVAAPSGLALVTLRRSGPVTAVRLLGSGSAPLPAGRPAARLPARDDTAADDLADGLLALLRGIRGPWRLSLTGLPLGDPVLARLAAGLTTAHTATSRSSLLVDALDTVGDVRRSTDPADLERWLPALLLRVPDRHVRAAVRAVARLHVAIGQLEIGVLAEGDDLRAVVLTLLDGDDRWPWWGSSDVGGLSTVRGAPVASLTATSELRLLTRRP